MTSKERKDAALLADKYIGRDGGPPRPQRLWTRPGKVGGQIVATEEQANDIRLVAAALSMARKHDALMAFSRLVGIPAEALEKNW